MKTLLCSLLLILSGLSSHAAITGQWDFENGDLSATIGSPMQYRGTTASQTQFGTATALGIANINGEVGRVMRFPACSSSQGYVLSHGAAPNGGGWRVNQYTLILDMLFPSASTGYRAFWQTDTNNTSDADLFVNGANGIGISGTYQGSLRPGAWHRVAFALDLTAASGQLSKYIDGALVGTQTLSEGVDGRWSLAPTALLFTDENGETGVGYVSSIQFHNRTLRAGEIAALGGASGGVDLVGGDFPGEAWLGGGQADFEVGGEGDVGGDDLGPGTGEEMLRAALFPKTIVAVLRPAGQRAVGVN